MDHWGDPWADNASDKSPTKNAVTSPLPPAFTFAPVPLNGFVDDAGWGNNDDDGFGDWATSPRVGTGTAALTELTEEEPSAVDKKDQSSEGWGSPLPEVNSSYAEERWSAPASPAREHLETVDSELSDTTTVAQLNAPPEEETSQESTHQSHPDVESSVRSSSSPSEASRNELPVESPRTSIEDERISGSITEDATIEEETAVFDKDLVATVADTVVEPQRDEDDESSSSEVSAVQASESRSTSPVPTHSSKDPEADEAPEPVSQDVDTSISTLSSTQQTAFACDTTLIAQLFPSTEESFEPSEASGDPIHTTFARKAWYRLTRKQTMREFNHGDNDDNYIRVNWTNSHVRTEVNKTVGRWAREDRISGNGPGARASFYWDSPAPVETKTPFGHSRTQSSMPTTKTALPVRQSLPPLATGKPVAFDWSSSASGDPWKLESPAQRSTSTPLTLKNPAVTKVQRQEGRAASVDLTPRKADQSIHKRTATVSHALPETTAVPSHSSPISRPSAKVSNSWADLNFDTPPVPATAIADAPIDDDDEWGEMVQTPTFPTSSILDPFPEPASPSDSASAVLSKPSLQKDHPVHTEPAETMFALPIVRLRSTISPTSALFKANTFVPLHAEEGPIGPGMLKPANRSVHSTPDKKPKNEVPLSTSPEPATVGDIPGSDAQLEGLDESSAFATAEPAALIVEAEDPESLIASDNDPSKAQEEAHIKASTDSWADADFSFFESALPATAPQPSSQTHDPSDPFSFFNTPAPTSTPPPAKLFSRSPPRDTTPPAPQPLTGATSSVQRRKAEEDQIISSILSGLPDLSYMLR
ncbi:hypothetical protein N0V94_007540 [Neodidymelliopsis sp. IMI 364377]|nr:hypothetical protein N0V94_007540 [Neodidymelliopsis sp. IMI 364377]